MTPLQELMLNVTFSAVLGIEMAFILLLLFGVVVMIVDAVKWARKRWKKRREERELDIPRHQKFD